ncbi:MAG: hypothetical protein GY937_23005 [bacterium]|nr:hypothetical protein [bacterium]
MTADKLPTWTAFMQWDSCIEEGITTRTGLVVKCGGDTAIGAADPLVLEPGRYRVETYGGRVRVLSWIRTDAVWRVVVDTAEAEQCSS